MTKKSNLQIKHTSTFNEIKDESFIISQSILNGIPLKLKRKIKSNEKYQKFIILEICDENIKMKFINNFQNGKKNKKKIQK